MMALLIVVMLAIAAFSAYRLISIKDIYDQANNVYSDLSDQYVHEIEDPVKKTEEEQKPEIKPETQPDAGSLRPAFIWDYESAHAQYPDIVGYIYQENTEYLSYPVLQGKTNDTYLRHLITGEYHIAGSIFVDSGFPYALESNYSIVYGHNMKNHSMFGSLLNYRDPEYYDDHKYFDIYAKDKHYRYHVFAVCTSEADGEVFTYMFDSEEDFVNLFESLRTRSDYQIDDGLGEITADDHFICLSTCTYDLNYSQRYTIIIRRGEEYDDSLFQDVAVETEHAEENIEVLE